MSQYDGRGKYLAVPITSQTTSGTDVTTISDATEATDTLVIANDYPAPACPQYREVSFRETDDVSFGESTVLRRRGTRQIDPLEQPTHLYLAIFALVVCPLCGVVALCYSVNARQSYAEGDIESGMTEANCAKMFAVTAMVTALATLCIFGIMLASMAFFFPTHF